MTDAILGLMEQTPSMLRNTVAWIRKNPYLSILIGVLAIISCVNIKFGYSILGIDNYSAFLNVNHNTLRSLLTTWRDYRGLGVVSDSEVTDIWRNLYYFLGQFVIPNNLLEQLYYLFTLNLGVLATYKLGEYIFKRANKDKSLSRHSGLFGFLAAFFYLFNINTLSVFYFPMLMFVARFYALPVTVYVLIRIMDTPKISTKKMIMYVALLLISSVTYIVPTIFITMLIVVFMVGLSRWEQYRRVGFALIIFILINFYWLLPFVNYSHQKSEDIKFASTFIWFNEGLLNKNDSYYAPERSILLIPQFYDMKYVKTDSNEAFMYHPLYERYSSTDWNIEKTLLWLFPALYILGGVLLLYKGIRSYEWLWIPATTFLFVFFSMNKFGPLGFIYSFIGKAIPIFEIIFRFGDTKFHAYIAFAGGLAAAYAVVFLYSVVQRVFITKAQILVKICLLLALIVYVFFYRSYFSGQLVGFFMYNKIPEAYYKISKTINSDPREGRVVHLPIYKIGYWKYYSWGYFGSSFMQYLLEKPLIDRTFEPASIENWALIEQLDGLQTEIQSVQNENILSQRAKEMFDTLSAAGIRYVVLDNSITGRVAVRGIEVRDIGNYSDSERMILLLQKLGYLKEVLHEDINLTSYNFRDMYPHYEPVVDSQKKYGLTLYELTDVKPQIDFISEVTETPVSLSWELLHRNGISALGHTIQRDSPQSMIFPFIGNDSSFIKKGQTIELSMPINQTADTYNYQLIDKNSLPYYDHLIEVTAARVGDRLTVQLYEIPAPAVGHVEQRTSIGIYEYTINETEFIKGESRSNIQFMLGARILDTEVIDHYRIEIDGQRIPLPRMISVEPMSIGAVLVESDSISVSLLERNGRIPIEAGTFTTLTNEECYLDQQSSFSHTSKVSSPSEIMIVTKNGSTCVVSSIIDIPSKDSVYEELHFEASGANKDLDKEFGYGEMHRSGKPILRDIVQSYEKPSYFVGCVRERTYGVCPIAPSGINLGQQKEYVIPVNTDMNMMASPVVYFEIRPSIFEEIAATIKNIHIDTYKRTKTDTVTIPPLYFSNKVVIEGKNITMSFPVDISNKSYLSSYGDDFPMHETWQKDSYRTVRLSDDNKLVSYIDHSTSRFSINLPYSSNRMYIWLLDYNLLSGEYPSYILEDDFRTLKKFERVSLWQGYPDVPGFRTFQNPEYFFTKEADVKDVMNSVQMSPAYTYIPPQPWLQDTKSKVFSIEQSSQNDGLMFVDSIDIINVPNYWANLALVPEDGATTEYMIPTKVSYKRIMPAMVKVDISSEKAGLTLLKFTEGYDKQWGVYESISGLMFGRAKSPSIRCDTYANCFEINMQKGSKTLYVFFWPERLAITGWIATIAGVIVVILLWRRKKLHA